MKKIDFKKEWKHLYGAKASQMAVVDVPAMNFLMVDGAGNPNTNPEYAQAVEALFSLSYAFKFHVKKGPMAIDYGVMPLEGLWWADDMNTFVADNKDEWKWTMMIVQPEFITPELVEDMKTQVAAKKDLPALPLLRFESFEEGHCAQTLHIGPFSEEGPTIARLHEFIGERGTLTGKHHEIYLSDIRRAAPEKWKTILRQPFCVKTL